MKSCTRRNFISSLGAIAASAAMAPAFPMRKALSAAGTGYAYHPDFESFENNSAETFLRARWINSRLVVAGVCEETSLIVPYENPMEYIKKVHTQSHIDLIEGIQPYSGFALTIGQGAKTAVGYVLGAIRDVCDGDRKNAFCCIRPPGHHVQNNGELGYCCYANVVIAARFAREKFKIKKILIIDWDFHQGNGTHGHICGDNDILFFETFSPNMYTTLCDDFTPIGPDSMVNDDARRINIRMPSGSTNDDFERVFETKLVPAADRFKPELVLISCGFDLKKNDTHGDFNVTAKGISRLTKIVRQIADIHAGGKLVSMLEGGYADSQRDASVFGTQQTFSGLSQCAENHMKTLITGELQPETSFYSGTNRIPIRPIQKRHLGWKNGILDGLPEPEGPFSLVITNLNGQTIKTFSDISGSSFSPDLKDLAPGRYMLSLRGKAKPIIRMTSIVL
jgi:acetoin utilization deacetylase AcuC-like enzyme